jgi:hypothetical protein
VDDATLASHGYFEAADGNPCAGCSAPCCRMLLIPHPTPMTFMDLDYIRYMLGFRRVGMVLSSDGTWQVAVDDVCSLLDQETNLCTVHGTPRKPKTCVFFNPYRCWYKRNFAGDDSPDLIRIDSEGFEILLAQVRFGDDGQIVELPSWEALRTLIEESADQPSAEPKPPGLPLTHRTSAVA